MEVSLEQAIEIHARVLKRVHGRKAPHKARATADHLATVGDQDGYRVWLKVADAAAAMLLQERPTASQA
jgi:hypothetical protein